ncbi:MAG: PEGA domain-containing protein [Myxococcota bacterium]
MALRRMMPVWLAAVIAAGTSTGCQPIAPQTVSMRVHGEVPRATVHIDDRYIGSFAMVKRRGVALPPGKHRITVERTGYFPWDALVEVQEGDPTLHLEVELKRIPD